MISGPERAPLSGKPNSLVVILHGWGADGHNLIDIADYWRAKLPDAHFIAPNGPEICEVNPYGFQWFSLMDRRPAVMLEGAKRASAGLNSFLDAKLAELKLGADRLALVGFSQGTMLSLYTAARRATSPACVLGYSGALLDAEVLAAEAISKPPVCLIHGEYDEVVPFAAMGHAERALAASGFQAEMYARPRLGHSIDMEGLEIGAAFLKKYVG